MSAKDRALIVVHPDSALGSADFNLGVEQARGARGALAAELAAWSGPVLVIGGSLAKEFAAYPLLLATLDKLLIRCHGHGFVADRRRGADGTRRDQRAVAATWIKQNPTLSQHGFTVTGAWYHRDGGGCVGSVITTLKNMGLETSLSPSAVWLDRPRRRLRRVS